MLSAAVPASAQLTDLDTQDGQRTIGWLDYDQTLMPYSWMLTGNAAGLTTYMPADTALYRLADAYVSAATSHGRFAPQHLAAHSSDVSVGVRSVYRMGQRVVFRGQMGYQNLWGKGAGGSVWINPRMMPFDITEYEDSTRGNTRQEIFLVDGAVGVSLAPWLSVGAEVNYKTSNYTKQRDPRHTNGLMLLHGSAGLMMRLGGGVSMGANYLLRRMVEDISFRTYGRTDKVYHYLIDNGAYFGRDEQTDGMGYTNNANQKPLVDMRHGAALQLAWERGDRWQWVSEVEYDHRHGHYGIESPSLLDYNNHQGDEWHLRSTLLRSGNESLHRLTLGISRVHVDDYERVYRSITSEGITDIHYYDSRLMGTIREGGVSLAYSGRFGCSRQLARWETDAAYEYSYYNRTASLYPFYRQQKTHLSAITLSGAHNVVLDSAEPRVFTLGLSLTGATGGGDKNNDGTYAQPSDEQQPPLLHEACLGRQYEWLTADRLEVGVRLRYAFPVARMPVRGYVEAGGHWRKAFATEYLEDTHRLEASLTLGCNF